MPGNPLAAPTAPDPHNVYAIGVDPSGYVHVVGNLHGNPLRYVRSENPLDIDGWVQGEMVGSEEQSMSYPAFVRAPSGALLFFYCDGVSGHGDVVLNRLDATADGWRRVATIIDGRSSAESPYLQRVAVDSVQGVIHLVFLWRSGADPDGNRDPSYLRSDDGGTTWKTSEGTVVPLPVTHRTAEVIAPTRDRVGGLLNQGGLAVDAAGRPHAVFRRRGGSGGRAGVLHVWRDESGWRAANVSGLEEVAGRPSLVGNGRHGLLLLWAESAADGRSELHVARMEGGRTADDVLLGSLPVDEWEPTFDSTALAERSELRMLLPVRRDRGPGPTAGAAVVTWSVPALG